MIDDEFMIGVFTKELAFTEAPLIEPMFALIDPPEVTILDVVVSDLPEISPAVDTDDTVTNVGSSIVNPPPIIEPLPAFIVLLLVLIA